MEIYNTTHTLSFQYRTKFIGGGERARHIIRCLDVRLDGWMDRYCLAIARGLEIITCFADGFL